MSIKTWEHGFEHAVQLTGFHLQPDCFDIPIRAIKGRDFICKNTSYPKADPVQHHSKRSFLFGEYQGVGMSQPKAGPQRSKFS